MSRRVEIICDKCGVRTSGTFDPNFTPSGWGHAELTIVQEVKVGKTREETTSALVCGPCAELIRQAIIERVRPIGGES